MTTSATLKDGSEVVIRPMAEEDLDRSFMFFQQLPAEDRKYLRMDVTRRENVAKRIQMLRSGRVKRLIALVNDEIVADGALELSEEDWMAHAGELRLIVGRPYQRKGLGMVMARELYALAASEKLQEIVVHMARPQVAAQQIFRRLGFQEEALLPEHIRDREGTRQDLVVMRCNLEAMWRELEGFFAHSDWQRAR